MRSKLKRKRSFQYSEPLHPKPLTTKKPNMRAGKLVRANMMEVVCPYCQMAVEGPTGSLLVTFEEYDEMLRVGAFALHIDRAHICSNCGKEFLLPTNRWVTQA